MQLKYLRYVIADVVINNIELNVCCTHGPRYGCW